MAGVGRGAASTWFLPSPALCSTLGRQALLASMRRDALRPDAFKAATARSGGQGRRRLAPGPEPRAATRRPAWAEHGEHGEDPPLARSEHRGTRANLANARTLSTA